jgi:hypothetical protein
MLFSILALSLLAFVSDAFAGLYYMTDNVVGSAFYTTFSFEAIPDPTHGRVSVVTLYVFVSTQSA